MGCKKNQCKDKSGKKACGKSSRELNPSAKGTCGKDNGCCDILKYANNYLKVTCSEPGNKYRPYNAICPVRCGSDCQSKTSSHFVSASECSCDISRDGCGCGGRGIYSPNNLCVNAFGCAGAGDHVRYENMSSLNSCCFGTLSSSSSSSRSCKDARAPKPCVKCSSTEDSCKYCIQDVFYKNRNHKFYNPCHQYKISRVSGIDCECSAPCKDKCKGKKEKTCSKKGQKGTWNRWGGKDWNGTNKKLYNMNDYKKKIENDRKKEGILVEFNNNGHIKMDGQARKKLELKNGNTYKFNVVQPTSDGIHRHFLVFTGDAKGLHTKDGKKCYPKPLNGCAKPCAHGTVKLHVTKDTPRRFYYQNTNTEFGGGQVIVL